MNNLYHKPNSQILQQGDKLYTIKQSYMAHMFAGKDKRVNKELLGVAVKYHGGDHVVQHQNKYYICEEIPEAEYETI